MGWKSTKTRSAIGLDVGSHWIKAVQLARKAEDRRVVAALRLPRDSSVEQITPQEIHRLRDAMARQGFAGRRVVLAAPEHKLISAILELPPRNSGAPVEQIARMELASMHRLDPTALELSLWDLPESNRQKETPRVMAAACVHAEADAFLDIFESQGLEVVGLDTALAATARLCDLNHASAETVTPVLDIGWRAVRLVVLYRGVMIYERQLGDAGIGALWQTLASRLEIEADVADYLINEIGLSEDREGLVGTQIEDIHALIRDYFEDAVRELGISFSYALHQYNEAEIESLQIVGGGAAIPGLAEDLSRQLSMPVDVVTPAGRLAHAPAVAELAGEPMMCQAAGLALHSAAGGGAA